MDFRREEIMPGVFLNVINTDKFKTSALFITLMSQLEHEHAYMDTLLPSVLRRGTVSCPDMASIARRLESLYGAGALPLSMRLGEIRITGIYSTFPSDRFLPGGRSELHEVASLLGEMLTAPNTRGGLLLPDYVNSEKAKLADSIRASRNDREGYASQRFLKLAFQFEDLSACVLDEPGEAESIHYTRLTRRYRELLAASPVEVCYCGDDPFQTVRAAVLDALGGLPRGEIDFDIGTDVRMNAIEAEPRRFFETMDVDQGKLVMGWRLGESMMEPDFAALRVFNALFGGTSASKLFRTVREEQGLCYYASSGIDEAKGLLVVTSGIAKENYDLVVGGICGELDAIAHGRISQEELDAARLYSSQMLRLVQDDPAEIVMHILRGAVTGEIIMPDELAAACECVTAEDVAAIAANAELDAIYFLSGEDEDEEDEDE